MNNNYIKDEEKELIELYITGAYHSISAFCKDNGVNSKRMKHLIELSKEDFPILYKKYLDYLELDRVHGYSSKLTNTIIDLNYAEEIISEYIKGNYNTKDSFCHINNISCQKFNHVISFAKQYLPSSYNLYQSYLKGQLVNSDYLKRAEDVITLFIKSDYGSKLAFCEHYGVSNEEFNDLLKMAESSIPNVYEQYKNHLYILDLKRKKANLSQLKTSATKSLSTQQVRKESESKYFDCIKKLLQSKELDPDKAKHSVPGSDIILRDKRTTIKRKYPNILNIFDNTFKKTYLTNDEEMIKTCSYVLEAFHNDPENKFDLIDYEQLSDIPFSLLNPTFELMDNKTPDDYRRIAFMTCQYKALQAPINNDRYIEKIMNTKFMDKDENPLINDSEKRLIIKYLLDNNIPLTYFKMALDAYLKNEIDVNEKIDRIIPNNIRAKVQKHNQLALDAIAQDEERKAFSSRQDDRIAKSTKAITEYNLTLKKHERS